MPDSDDDGGADMVSSSKRLKGEGSIYQRHDRGCPPLVEGVRPKHKCANPWVGVLVTGYKGKTPIRKKVSASTESGAGTKLLELRDQLDALPIGKPITVAEWMKHWLARIAPVEVAEGTRVRRVKEGTVETYRTNVEQYIIPLLGHHRLDRLTSDHIEDAWDYLFDVGNPLKDDEARVPLSANSVHLAHSILRRALKVAVQKKRLRISPAGTDAMDAPAKSDKEIEPIPFADVDKILKAATGKPGAARWSVALSLGLRPGEVRGLRWADVDLKAGMLTVAQQMQRRKGRGMVSETPKSKSGTRLIVLPAKLLAAMTAHRKEQAQARLKAGDHWTDHDLVFCLDNGKPMDSKVDHRRWYALLEDAGVERRRLYDARHSAATMLLAQDVPPRVAMDILGHSNIAVTMRYQHAVSELKLDAAKKMDAADWSQG